MIAPDRRPEREPALVAGEKAEERGDYVQAAAAYAEVTEDSDPAAAGEGHFRLGRVNWHQGRFEHALSAFEHARSIARDGGFGDLEARAENGIGTVHYARGEYAQAKASYQIAMERTKDPVLVGRFMLNLGAIANIEGNLESALWHYLRARNLFRDNGDRMSESLALHNLGMLYADREEWEAAGDAFEQCLGICEFLGNRAMIPMVLLSQAEVFIAQEDYDRAIRACEVSISISVEIGNEVGRGEAFRWLGHAQRKAGNLEGAERTLTEAVLVAQRFRVKLLEAEACREMWELKRSDADRRRWRERALSVFRELGAEREVAAREASE